MPEYKRREDPFIVHLQKVQEQKNDGNPQARAALARLRKGLSLTEESFVRISPEVIPYLPSWAKSREEEDRYYLIATLFASHDMPGGEGTMGKAFEVMKSQLESKGSSGESVERRFVALINRRIDDLPRHLRHAVSLLASHDIPVDWQQLLSDLRKWDDPDRHVQHRWAREFWSPRKGEGPKEGSQN